MDDVIGWGGQLGSFEAVFSPLDRDGRPRKLWDRATGAIDPEVAKAWEAYDIRLVLERNWPTLGPKLKGKLHVITGDLDTFYLEGAVKLLKESLAKLGSDAVVEIIPGRDHGTRPRPRARRSGSTARCKRPSASCSREIAGRAGFERLIDRAATVPLASPRSSPMPVLEREEYIEQAYFFRAFRERLLDGLPSQEILARIGEELLSTTKLPLAVSFLHTEIKGTGLMGPAMARISHYFTPFQAHVVGQAENDTSRFPMEQALLVLEREAKFKAEGPSLPALFVFQFEALSRNRLGYNKGLAAMAADPFYTEDWQRLHPDAPHPAGRRRFRRPDLRPLRATSSTSGGGSTPTSSPSSRSSSARRRGRSPAPTAAATRCTSSRPSSASSATPKSPAPAVPTSSRPASLLLEQQDRPARKPPQGRRERHPARRRPRPGHWSSPRTPPASRRAGAEAAVRPWSVSQTASTEPSRATVDEMPDDIRRSCSVVLRLWLCAAPAASRRRLPSSSSSAS